MLRGLSRIVQAQRKYIEKMRHATKKSNDSEARLHYDACLVGVFPFDEQCFFFSSRRRHTILQGDWSSDVCYSDLRSLTTRAPTGNGTSAGPGSACVRSL